MARVLVVEDEGRLARLVARVLGEEGYAVETVGDGRSALVRALAETFDVLVVDWMLPDLDGVQVVRRLRAAEVGVPVLMLTARDQIEDRVEGLDAGADDYLAKPFQAAELLARVRAVAERGGGRAAPMPERPGPRPAEDPGAPPPAPSVVVEPLPASALPPVPPAHPGPAVTSWRLPATAESVVLLRRRLGSVLTAAGVGDDRRYDLLLAACEAFTNAVEHAQDPIIPYVDVRVAIADDLVEIAVRDFGQWRERVASLDRGRGSTLMSAVGDVTATPSPEGTTVVLRAPR
jgi:CheY-like chemotaxis protein/anti-sigma regulatory factor (Ser/Thr protein kinase)